MKIEFDPDKRQKTLDELGLDLLMHRSPPKSPPHVTRVTESILPARYWPFIL
jgi:hypothetical protein